MNMKTVQVRVNVGHVVCHDDPSPENPLTAKILFAGSGSLQIEPADRRESVACFRAFLFPPFV